jgi:signal transduction histidine kinase
MAAQSASARFIALFSIVLLTATMLVAFLMWSSYQQDIRNAETTTRNYAAILEARLDAALRVADQSTRRVAANIPVSALRRDNLRRFDQQLNADLESRIAGFPELVSLRVFDALGDLMYASDAKRVSPINIADRALFRIARDNLDDKPVFSDVIVARSSGERIVVIEKAVRDGGGGFQGVVGASLNLNYFLDIFKKTDIGPGGVIAIYRSDAFTPVLRWPPSASNSSAPLPADSPTRQALPPGTSQATIKLGSAADGITRIYSYKKLGNYPFFISVGISYPHILAEWRERPAVVALVLLLILGLSAMVLLRLRRAEAALLGFNAELEQRVHERTNKLEEVNAELEAFMYTVSHDLKAPLRAIDSNSAILEQDLALAPGSESGKHFSRIRANVQRMTQLLGELLDLSRSSTKDLRMETVDMRDKVAAVIGELDYPPGSARFEIGELPACRGDRTQLRQLWANLIDNAVKFSAKAGQPLVRIGFANGAYFVADNGVGFDMAYADNLFKLFSRLHHERDFPGTGSGLAIVKRIVERHGGTVSASAKVGEGARFEFTIAT